MGRRGGMQKKRSQAGIAALVVFSHAVTHADLRGGRGLVGIEGEHGGYRHVTRRKEIR
jgi:hypothetical protein